MYDENFLPGADFRDSRSHPNRREGDATVLLIAHKLESLHEDVGAMRSVLKDLTTAITKLALIEERQTQSSLAQERAFKVLEKLEARVDKLEAAAPINNQASSLVMRALWAAGAAAAMFVAIKTGLTK